MISTLCRSFDQRGEMGGNNKDGRQLKIKTTGQQGSVKHAASWNNNFASHNRREQSHKSTMTDPSNINSTDQ